MRTGIRAKRKVSELPLNGHIGRKPAIRGSVAASKSEKNIFAVIGEIAEKIPQKDLLKIPKDLSINLDHYLYGTPKVEPWRPV